MRGTVVSPVQGAPDWLAPTVLEYCVWAPSPRSTQGGARESSVWSDWSNEHLPGCWFASAHDCRCDAQAEDFRNRQVCLRDHA